MSALINTGESSLGYYARAVLIDHTPVLPLIACLPLKSV